MVDRWAINDVNKDAGLSSTVSGLAGLEILGGEAGRKSKAGERDRGIAEWLEA